MSHFQLKFGKNPNGEPRHLKRWLAILKWWSFCTQYVTTSVVITMFYIAFPRTLGKPYCFQRCLKLSIHFKATPPVFSWNVLNLSSEMKDNSIIWFDIIINYSLRKCSSHICIKYTKLHQSYCFLNFPLIPWPIF